MRTLRSLAVVVALGTLSSVALADGTAPSPSGGMAAKKPVPATPPPPPDLRALKTRFDGAAYERLFATSNPAKDAFTKAMTAAQTVSGRVADPSALARKAGLDTKTYAADVKAMLAEKDAQKQAQLRAELDLKYGAKLVEARKLAGLAAPAKGTRLTLGSRAVRAEQGIAADLLLGDKGIAIATANGVLQQGVEGDPQRQEVPAPPSGPSQRMINGPFSDAWNKNLAEGSPGADRSGKIQASGLTAWAGSTQTVGAITQDLHVDPGVRRVRVYAPMRGQYNVSAFGVLSYGSAEALLNLRVLDGSTVLCSDRVSLARAIAVVFGDAHDVGSFDKTLSCEAVRPNPQDPGELSIEVDAELWTGAGGLASTMATVAPRSGATVPHVLQRLDVITSRD